MTDGDISKLHLWSFIVDKEVITQVILSGKLLQTISPRQEKMLSNIPEDHQEDPGEIVEICLNPWQEDQMLIGYSAGFMMLWDNNTKSLLNILKSPKGLPALTTTAARCSISRTIPSIDSAMFGSIESAMFGKVPSRTREQFEF